MTESHRLVVDRFEGDLAVVEDEEGRFFDLPRWFLPAAVREGDVVVVREWDEQTDTRRVEVRVDPIAAEAGRGEARAILDRIGRRDPGGNLDL